MSTYSSGSTQSGPALLRLYLLTFTCHRPTRSQTFPGYPATMALTAVEGRLTRASIEIPDGATRPRSVCLKINELFGESSALPHTRGPH